MPYRLQRKYPRIVKKVEVVRYRKFGKARELVARIYFKDGSVLHVKDYLFLSGERKYAFHWQDAHGHLLVRWDNSPHYPDLKSFPHHRHVGDRIIEESIDMSLDAVLSFIEAKMPGGG